MGRKTDVILRGFRAARCLTLLKLVSTRIKVLKNKRSISAKQMRGEIAQLLKSGQDAHVYITKADALIKQENMVAVYGLIDEYCHAIISRFPAVEMQRDCPIDMKEPIASIIFAAPRCVELTELATIKEAFIAKYGKDFAAAAAELRPDCGVNRRIIELLSTRPASGQRKVKIMKEICVEHNVQWTPPETLLEPSTSTAVGSSQQHGEAVKVPGDVGSNKEKLVAAASARVDEAGPSKIVTQTPLPGGPKHAGSTKLGLAAAESLKTGDGTVLVSGASKTSDTKFDSLSKENVGKATPSVFQSVKAAMIKGTSSGKFGVASGASENTGGGTVLAKESSKIHDTTHSSFADEDVERLNARIFQSLKGSLDTGTSNVTFGSCKEPKGELEGKADTDVHVKLVDDAQDGMNDSDNDSFVSVEEGRFEDDIEPSSVDALISGRLEGDIEASSVGAASKRESFPKIPLQAFEEADVNGPNLGKKPSREVREISSSYTESSLKDVYSRASSKSSSSTINSSLEDTFHRASSKNSMNTEALLDEKSFRKESRKSSLRDNELAEGQLFKDKILMEKVAEDSLKLAEGQSFKDKILMEEKVAGEESSEAIDEEGLRKDALEDLPLGATTESSGAKKPVEEYGCNVKMTTKELHDEGNLPSKGIFEDMPVVETTERLVMEKLVEESPLEASQNKMTTEYLSSLPASDMQKMQSFSDRISAEEIISGAGKESCLSNEKLPESGMSRLPGKEVSLNLDKSPENMNNQIGSISVVEKRVEDLLGASSSGALATSDYSNDFAATAKAIAAEAARLAVLDYAKRMAGSNAIPIDLGDLTKFGLAFEESAKGPLAGRILNTKGESVRVDSQDAQYEGDSMNARKDVVQEEKVSKVEIPVYADKGDKGGPVNIDEMGYIRDVGRKNSLHSKMPGAVEEGHVNDAIMGNTWTSTEDEVKQQPEITTGNDDINPFATEIVTKDDEDTHPLFLKTGDHDSLSTAKPGLMSKGGGFGQEEDHLDVFFRRKTAWLHEEYPRFDEDRYSFVNIKSSFMEDKVPYQGFGKKESSFQDSFVPTPVFDNVKTPVFDNVPEMPSTFSEESSSSFKSPVFDEGPEQYDASFSFNDGLIESTPSVDLSDKQGPQSPPNIKVRPTFDVEPEPRFDKVLDEGEQFSMGKKESTQMGHLKWQSKKTEANVGSATSDASLGGASNPMSRRSRRQPQKIDDYEYDGEMLADNKSTADGGNSSRLASNRPIGSSSSLMQQQQKEQGRKDKDNVAEKGNVRAKPVESFGYISDVMSKRPSSISPKRVSRQDHDPSDESQCDRWDSTSTIVGGRFPSSRTTKSPTRLAQGQEVPLQETDEEYYFAEGKNQFVGSSSASSSVNAKSPARVAKQQLFAQGYDDAEGYKMSTKPSRQSKLLEQDSSEDDIEEIQVRYKPPTQTNDVGKRTSASMGTYSQQQPPHHRREEYNSESGYKQYGQIKDVGRSNPSSRLPAHQKQQGLEEEQDLSTLYKPSVQVDDLVKSSPSRPLSSRQQQKIPIEEEGPALASRYKPIAQLDDLGRASSSPHGQRHQRRQEQEVFMVEEHGQQQDEEELYSMPLPDRLQEQRREEKQYIAMPLYGHRQESNPEKKSSELYMEEHEQQQEQGQEKRHRPVPTSGRRREELQMEKENPGASQQEQEQQWPISGRWQQKILGEEEAENWQQRPILGRRQQQKTLAEGEAENWQQRPISGRRQQHISLEEEAENPQHRPISGRWSQQILVEEEVENWQQRPISGRRQQKNLVEEEVENWQQQPISGRRQQQILAEEEAENWQQRPVSGRRQQPSLAEEQSAENWQQPVSGRRQQQSLAEEEMENGQQRPVSGRRQEKSLAEEEDEIWERRPIRQQQSLVKEEMESRQQRPISGRRQQGSLAEEEVEIWQRRRIAGRQQQQSWAEKEAENGQQLPISARHQKKSWAENEQQPVSGSQQQQDSVKEEVNWPQQPGRENKHSPSPLHEKSPMEPIELQQEVQQCHPTTLPEEHQEQAELVTEDRPSPLYNSKLELSKEQLQSQTKEEVKEQKEKPGVKSQPPARRPPSFPAQPAASSPLESSVSDPIILATIPPPVKKTVLPLAPADTKLQSSVSTPPSSVPEVKGTKPQKAPNVDDLLANFEAFRKARKGQEVLVMGYLHDYIKEDASVGPLK